MVEDGPINVRWENKINGNERPPPSLCVPMLVLPSFTEFYWVLLGFTEFYWVLLGFTGFYLVLLGFTGFHWVYVVNYK